MKPIRKFLTLAAVGGISVATWQVGSSLVKDVRFAGAQERVADARASLSTAGDMSGAYKLVNHAMENSVVHITVSKPQQQASNLSPQDLFKFFGPQGPNQGPNQGPDQDGQDPDDAPRPRRRGQPPVPQPQPEAPDGSPGELQEYATGSGAIMDAANGEAYIITNNHVVADAAEVDVTLNDGRRINNAVVVGTDPKSDVAVVKIKADRVIAAKWGDSGALEKGDIIVAFGSPFGFVGSMSHGIVSALNRDRVGINRQNGGGFDYENFIQVDAAINPGNSGGPLVNLKGEVVGINTAIASRTGSFAGIGFAIPSNQAKGVYEQLKNTGKVTRGYLGVGIDDIHSDSLQTKAALELTGFTGETGIIVSRVMSNSPALNVLKLNDVITELDGKSLKSMTEFRTLIAGMQPGTTVKLKVWRDGKFTDASVKLGTQPESDLASAGGARPGRPAPQATQQMGAIGLSVVTPTADDLEAAGLPGDAKGVLVKQVRPGSPAALFGVQPGDLITRIGPTAVATAEEAAAAFKSADAGKALRLDTLSKQGERMLVLPKRTK